MPHRACLVLAAAVLAGLLLPGAALGQPAAPTLTEAPGSGFPDRQYVLRLPSPRVLRPGSVTITENGRPPSGQVGIEALETGAAQGATRRYLLTYRSLLPPETQARVRASVGGLPAATARYTTPELLIEPRGDFEQSSSEGIDIATVRLLMVAVLLSALALWVVARVRARRL